MQTSEISLCKTTQFVTEGRVDIYITPLAWDTVHSMPQHEFKAKNGFKIRCDEDNVCRQLNPNFLHIVGKEHLGYTVHNVENETYGSLQMALAELNEVMSASFSEDLFAKSTYTDQKKIERVAQFKILLSDDVHTWLQRVGGFKEDKISIYSSQLLSLSNNSEGLVMRVHKGEVDLLMLSSYEGKLIPFFKKMKEAFLQRNLASNEKWISI